MMIEETGLWIGGLVAVGFDSTGKYLLAISHDGRGVFSTETWKRVARDSGAAYPESGIGIGIGPIDGESIPVIDLYWDSTDEVTVTSPDGRFELKCRSDGIQIMRVAS